MANQIHAFKHRDIIRIIKAARAAGIEANQVTVDPHTGKITVGPAQRAAPPPARAADAQDGQHPVRSRP